MSSAESNQPSREQRRARHAQRVSALRAERERKPAASAYADADPFAVFADAGELAKAEEVFPA